MDTFVDSSWYFIHYLDPKNNREIADETLTDLSLPVDLYIGGKEHAMLHPFMHGLFAIIYIVLA